MEVQNLRPAYWKFLLRLTQGRYDRFSQPVRNHAANLILLLNIVNTRWLVSEWFDWQQRVLDDFLFPVSPPGLL